MTDLMLTLVRELKHIDAEARPLPNGTPTGLWWYHRHLQGDGPAPGKYRNEERIFAALMHRIIAIGIEVLPEQYYPKVPGRRGTQRCDLVLNWPVLGRTWLEVKCAWRHNDSKGLSFNSNYPKHLRAAAKDASKLMRVDPTLVDTIALLLIGFDQTEDPIPESDIDVIRATARGWNEQSASWHDKFRARGEVKLWLWTSAVPKNPESRSVSSALGT